jgi:hypothetical protein
LIRRIYVASSWRNEYQPDVVSTLREQGHQVYDFRNPDGATGLAWAEIDPNWRFWTVGDYLRALETPRADSGFRSDWSAMQWSDTCVLVLPCGRSAHIEAGYFVGAGKTLAIYLPETRTEPELMYKMAHKVSDHFSEILDFLQ